MRKRLFNVVIACASAMACDVSNPSPPKHVRIDPGWVSGAARADVGPDGRFRFQSGLPYAPDEVSRERALELTVALVRTLANSVGNLRESLEEWHGGPIDFALLQPCGPVIPKLGIFESIPSEPRQVRTDIGNSYVIEMCNRSGLRQVELELFTRTQMMIDEAGYIVWPRPLSAEFVPAGVPRHTTVDLTPEFGARLVNQATGVRIDSVPELDGCLFARAICNAHLGRHWRFHMEDAVTVRVDATGEVVTTRVLYTQAGQGAYDHTKVYIIAPIQPEGQWFDFLRGVPPEQVTPDSVYVRLVRPIALQSVTVQRNAR